MTTYHFLQLYWWALVSLLGALLVFLMYILYLVAAYATKQHIAEYTGENEQRKKAVKQSCFMKNLNNFKI